MQSLTVPVIFSESILPKSENIFSLKLSYIIDNRKESLIGYIWIHIYYADKNKAATLAKRSHVIIEW